MPKRLIANAEVATVLGSIPASSETVESEGRQMKQCWIIHRKKKNPKNPKNPPVLRRRRHTVTRLYNVHMVIPVPVVKLILAILIGSGFDLIGSLFRDVGIWIRIQEEQNWMKKRLSVQASKNSLAQGADPDPHYFWKLDPVRLKSWIRIRIIFNIPEL